MAASFKLFSIEILTKCFSITANLEEEEKNEMMIYKKIKSYLYLYKSCNFKINSSSR